jgi:hypothetical protein
MSGAMSKNVLSGPSAIRAPGRPTANGTLAPEHGGKRPGIQAYRHHPDTCFPQAMRQGRE